MYSNTVYAELLKAIPRPAFRRLVRQHQTDKHSKGFSSWDHLLAMVFAQITGVTSLREIEAGFNQHRFQHYHLGTHETRSTLFHRPETLYQQLQRRQQREHELRKRQGVLPL